MKTILIVHTPRSGARSLLFAISDAMKIPWWDNPFAPRPGQPGYNEIKEKEVWLERPDRPVVMKTNIIEHLKPHGKVHYFTIDNIMNIKDWFDHILILDRREKSEQAISLEHGDHFGWKLPYVTNPHLQKISQRWVRYLKDASSTIELLAGKLGVSIHYYEDLYTEDKTYRKKNLGQKGIPYNEEWFQKDRRYRDNIPIEEVEEFKQKNQIQGHYDEHGQFISKDEYDKQK